REILGQTPLDDAAATALEKYLEGDRRVAVAQFLAPIHEQAGRWARLIKVYEVLVEGDEDSISKISLLQQIADLHRKLGDKRSAFEALARALKADPSSTTTSAELEALAAELDAWDSLAQALRDVLSKPLALQQQVALRCRLGALYAEKLGQKDKA